jgi:hypothetical protein
MSLQQIQWKTSRKARETGDGDWSDTHILRAGPAPATVNLKMRERISGALPELPLPLTTAS